MYLQCIQLSGWTILHKLKCRVGVAMYVHLLLQVELGSVVSQCSLCHWYAQSKSADCIRLVLVNGCIAEGIGGKNAAAPL